MNRELVRTGSSRMLGKGYLIYRKELTFSSIAHQSELIAMNPLRLVIGYVPQDKD